MASAALQLCGMLAQAAEYASELPPPPPVGGQRQAQLGLCDLKAVPPRGTSLQYAVLQHAGRRSAPASCTVQWTAATAAAQHPACVVSQ